MVSKMPDRSRSRILGYGFIAAGLVLAFVSAIVPFYTSGHRLLFTVFLVGIMPYLAYGLVVALYQSALTTLTGVVLLALHGWFVINERFIGCADYSGGMIYIGPLLLTALLFPLLIRALLEPWHK